MNLTSLTQKLLNDKELEISDKGFMDSYESFIAFTKGLGGFAVYFDKAHNYANTANTAYLTRRLSELTGIAKNNVRLIYDKNDAKLLKKIERNLPFLNEYLYSENGKNINEKFVICGGSEQNDPFWGELSLYTEYIMTIRPYLDAADFSIIKIRNKRGEWVTFFTDTITMNQPFPMRNFYIDLAKIKAVPNDVKAYYKSYNNLHKAEHIIESVNTSIFTISGLATENSAMDRGDNCVLILALASLAKLKKDNKAVLLVFTDYSKTDDTHFSLLKAFCKKELDSEELFSELKVIYPQSGEADLKTGLLNPLLQKRSELSSVLDKVVFIDEIKTFDAGKISICPIGALPYDYIAALYAKSNYVFFESCDYMNLAINLGVPFLHKAIEEYSGYPDFLNPGIAAKLEQLCNIFKSDINAYTFAFNKNLYAEINLVYDFLEDSHKEYFNALSLYAQGKSGEKSPVSVINDKLATSAGVFHMLHNELRDKHQNHVLFRNNNEIIDFKGLSANNNESLDFGYLRISYKWLHAKLQSAFDKQTNTLNISKALQGMRFASYLLDLTGGVVSLDSVDDIVLDYYQTDIEATQKDDDDICGVSIIKAKSSVFEGGIFEIKFTDWQGGESYGIYIKGDFNNPNNLFGLPWLKFSDVNFSVITAENNMPLKGSVGGTFGRTSKYPGVNFVIDLNYQSDITRIMAVFKEPLSAFEAFGAIAGGINFDAQLPPVISEVVTLGLSELVFYYDKKNNTITSMNFIFTNLASEPWVLWKREGKAILTASPTIGITVHSPADLVNRHILVSVGAFVDIGDIEAITNNGAPIGQLWFGASYPPFVAEMRMSSEKISIDKLLEIFGCSDLKLNANITDLRVLADFENNVYLLSAAVDCNWKITDNFEITGLGLHIADRAGRFSIGFAGSMRICSKVDVGLAVGYNAGDLNLSAKIKLNDKNTISMSELVNTYKGPADLIAIDANEDNPLVAGLDFSLTKKANSTIEFEISAAVDNWEISSIGMTVSANGKIGKNAEGFYAGLKAHIELLNADFVISLNYGKVTNIQLEWGIFKGEIVKTQTETTASISLYDFSIGDMIETFIGWLYGSKFSLDSPWDLLNEIRFDIELTYSFTNKKFSFEIKNRALNFGLGTLEAISVTYNPNAAKKIDVSLSIKYKWGESENLNWDASQPGTAPAPAGMGSKYFDLRYLAFGQKVQFFEKGYNPPNTETAINKLIERTNPDKFPSFDKDSGMLVAADFGILKSEDKVKGTQYFIDAALVFYDPGLFALRITFSGKAAKIFDGFMFEIIYAKLSETLGVFKATIVLPDKFRKLDLGAYSITFPDFYIEVYTNGDFKIDIGFPKNGDFSRSLSLSGIVPPGIPITGAIGFYFGKLSSATAESSGIYLPVSNKGNFNPAIVFGIGVRAGIGKSINYGILSGGFSLTVSFIFEGVIAKWNSYEDSSTEEWYYKLKGTASLIGLIYGKIDFVLICASVNIGIGISVEFVLESYRKTLLTIKAYVEASASLTINLGLFKITIGFSFKTEVKESFEIGQDKPDTPWGNSLISSGDSLVFLFPKAKNAAYMNFANLIPDKKTVIGGNISLASTAALDEYGGKEKYVVGNVILTLKSEHFDVLAETLMYWVIAAACGNETKKTDLYNFVVTDDYLAGIEEYLQSETMPVSCNDAERFLHDFFTINIIDIEKEAENLDKDDIAGTYFPIPPDTEFNYGDNGCRYTLREYNEISLNAVKVFKDIFNKLAVIVEDETRVVDFSGSELMSVAEMVFCDWFALAVSHIIRSMRKNLKDNRKESDELNQIIKSLAEKNFYSELSGMLSRFFLHGLRLPTTSKDEILIKPKKSGIWVKSKNDTLYLPNEAGIFSLTGQAFILPPPYELSARIKSGNDYLKIPEHFSLKSNDAKSVAENMREFNIPYSFDEVKAEFIPEAISFGNPAEIGRKYFWTIPKSLSAYFDTTYLSYPKFELCMTDDNNSKANFSPIAMIEFDLEETDIDCVYIIGGAPKQTIDILQKIITYKPKISNIEIINKSLFSTSGDGLYFAVSQINMSSETRPPENFYGVTFQDTLKLIWKALITNNRGYILTYRDSAKTKLGEKITLSVTFDFTLETAGYHLALINAVSSDSAPQDGKVLMAFAKEYTISVSPDKNMSEISEKHCTDIRRIAENNLEAILIPHTKWHFENLEDPSEDEPVTQENEKLVDFAKRMNTTPAYALWLNRDKANLFKSHITIIVQPGFRMPSGSENTLSAINESYIIRRPNLPLATDLDSISYANSLLLNNYSLLSYGVNGDSDSSAPYSYRENSNGMEYNIIMPADKYYGGGYSSYGKLIQNRFNWLDYYGNKLVPEFYSLRLAGYQDIMPGLSKWHSIGTHWTFKDTYCVLLNISFRTDDYITTDERGNREYNVHACKRSLQFYNRLLVLINDKNLKIYLNCSVFDKPSTAINKKDVTRIIIEIIEFLSVRPQDIPELILKPLEFSFENTNAVSSAIFPLECSFVMERNGFASKGFEEVKGIMCTESFVGIDNLCEFANAFNNIFESLVALKSSGAAILYAYRVSGMSIYVELQNIELFLPRPISNTLANADGILIKQYSKGSFAEDSKKINYRAVDLNIWLRNALKFMDDILSANIVNAAGLVNAAGYTKSLSVNNNESLVSGSSMKPEPPETALVGLRISCKCDYNNLLKIKESLAAKLSKILSLGFRDRKSGNDVPIEAQELFKQRLLGSLSSFYGVKAIAVLPAKVTGLPENAVFFGNLTDSANNNSLSYSSPKLKNGEQNLVFAVSGADIVLDNNGAVLPAADLELTYNITHIESGIKEIVDGFNCSEWYGKIKGDIIKLPFYDKGFNIENNIKIPFPLHTFCETPVMVSQQALESKDIYSWRYSFTYSRSYNYPQQICHCSVKYNTVKNYSNEEKHELFNALAQIDSSGIDIYTDLYALADKINNSPKILPDSDIANNFTKIFECAEDILSLLDKADFDTSHFVKSVNLAQDEIKFSVVEGNNEGGRFCISVQTSESQPPGERIEPKIEGCESEYLDEERVWVFRKSNGSYLIAAEGQAINKRTFIMPPRNILQYQNAVAEVYIRQNEQLGGKVMNDDFIFTTPAASFDSAISVHRVVTGIDLADDKAVRSLGDRLTEYLSRICCGDIILEARGTYLSEKYNEIVPLAYPIFSQTQTQIIAGDFNKAANGWIVALRDWRNNFESPDFEKGDTLYFEFIFYSSLKMPLLIIKDAYISGEYIV